MHETTFCIYFLFNPTGKGDTIFQKVASPEHHKHRTLNPCTGNETTINFVIKNLTS